MQSLWQIALQCILDFRPSLHHSNSKSIEGRSLQFHFWVVLTPKQILVIPSQSQPKKWKEKFSKASKPCENQSTYQRPEFGRKSLEHDYMQYSSLSHIEVMYTKYEVDGSNSFQENVRKPIDQSQARIRPKITGA